MIPKVQLSFKSNNSFDKMKTKPSFKTAGNTKFKQNQNNDHFLLYLGILAGVILIPLGIFKRYQYIMNTPPKTVTNLLEEKSVNIDRIINKTKEIFEKDFDEVNEDLSKTFRRSIEPNQEISETLTQMQKVQNKEKLLQDEEICFESLSCWFNKNLDADKKSPEELMQRYKELDEKLKQKLRISEENALEQIKTESEIPKDIQGKLRTKKIIEDFNSHVNKSKRIIKTSKDETINNLKEEAQDLFREYNNSSGRIVADKNNTSAIILSVGQQKLESFIASTMHDLKETTKSVNMDIIPTTMPLSILNNKFYQFVSSTSEMDFKSTIPEFIGEMGEKLSLKDIQILIKRMELRQKANIENINSFSWYENKIKQLKGCETKISEYLENSFYNSGKNIDVNHLTLEQEEQFIFYLQEHAKRMGYHSIDSMMTHFITGDKMSEFGERWEKYHKSSMSKIYPKINVNRKSYYSKIIGS